MYVNYSNYTHTHAEKMERNINKGESYKEYLGVLCTISFL